MTPPRRPDDDTPFPPLPPLPVAEPVRPDPLADDPVVAEVVGPRADDPDALPVAVPVRPPRPSDRERPRRPRPVDPPPPPEPQDEAPARPRVLAACSVLGCLGLGVLAAVGFLAYGAIRILNHVGDRIGDPDRPAAVAGGWARPDPVGPTKLAGDTASVPVGGTFDAVGRAAGGRFLLFRVPAQRRVVAFDANTGAMRPDFTLGLTEPNSLIAGGASKLWVYKPQARELVRCDLLTGRPEQRAKLPNDFPGADAMAVGAGSDGPVYLVSAPAGGVEVRKFDGVTLDQVGMVRHGGGVGRSVRARASDDGTLLAVSGPSGALAVRFPAGGEAKWATLEPADGRPPGVATPAPDGAAVYTPRGAFGPDGAAGPGTRDEDFYYAVPPAHGGGLYLTLGADAGGRLEGPPKVHRAGSRITAGRLDRVRVPRGLKAADTGDITPDQRIYLWPAAGLAATLPPVPGDTIELTRVDVPAVKGGRGE